MSDAAPSKAAARRLRSMTARVVLVAVVSAALAGFAAALVAIAAVDQLLAEQVDLRLRAATVTLAGELDEDEQEAKQPDSLDETLEDENQEIRDSGIRLAVFYGGVLMAGAVELTWIAPGSCTTRGGVGARIRACARSHHDYVLVAAQRSDASRLAWLYTLAIVGAVLLGAGTGAALSSRLSRWAVAPLERLARALRSSRPEQIGTLDLGAPSNVEQVEAVRGAVRELAERVQVLLDQARRFAADAAHELRTPLTALRAELELLAEESSGASREALERASARAARLSDRVERLLVLAIPEHNVQRGFETLAVADAVQDVLGELPVRDRERIRLDLGGEGLVRGDSELLRALVSNAVQNALKFAPHGTIGVRLADPGGTPSAPVLLEVTDEGPGVPPALRGRVFEPFFRADPRDTRGYGLGLALIGHIARVHEGHAEFVDSDVGARLRVVLPAWSAVVRRGGLEPPRE